MKLEGQEIEEKIYLIDSKFYDYQVSFNFILQIYEKYFLSSKLNFSFILQRSLQIIKVIKTNKKSLCKKNGSFFAIGK